MDFPSWLPKPDYSKRGMLLELARCIFEMHYREELHAVKGPMRTFDNMCNGDLERAASVLQMSGFIQYIDDISRRSVFLCEPYEFEGVADSKMANEIDAEIVREAVIRLANGNVRSSLGIQKLAKEATNEPRS